MMKEIEKLKENRSRKQLEKIKLEEEKNRLNKGFAKKFTFRASTGKLLAVD
jgi:hypothetical protein